MSEHRTQNEIRLAVGGDAALFRNNVAQAWVGEVTRLKDGSVLIHNPRILHAGLFKGSGDLIGWRSIEITPDMVGQRVAVFASIEVKPPKGGRITKEQVEWAEKVVAAGGFGGIARSPEDAKKILRLTANGLPCSPTA